MQKPRLLDQVREVCRVRHYSHRTEKTYIHWIRRYIFFHDKRHPKEMGAAEINAFLSWLATSQKVAAATQNQAMNALVFLYHQVLKVDPGDFGDVVRAKKPKRLPVVLSRNEVQSVLSHLHGDWWLVVSLLYGSGLRLMEGLKLRVKDLDFEQFEVTVREGKGGYDRRTMLPALLVEPLQKHLRKVKSIHEDDLAAGYGEVWLPGALARKYRMRGESGDGSTCSRRRDGHSIRTAVRSAVIILLRRISRRRSRLRCARPASPRRSARTPFGTVSPPTCWKPVTTSAPCRSCWGTRMSKPR